jgi:hypothetical protein
MDASKELLQRIVAKMMLFGLSCELRRKLGFSCGFIEFGAQGCVGGERANFSHKPLKGRLLRNANAGRSRDWAPRFWNLADKVSAAVEED